AFAGIIILAALGAPWVVPRRCGRDGGEAGQNRRAEHQQHQLRLAHDPTPLLPARYTVPSIIRFRGAVLFQINETNTQEKSPAGRQGSYPRDHKIATRPSGRRTRRPSSISRSRP